jgi:hypothetical protein
MIRKKEGRSKLEAPTPGLNSPSRMALLASLLLFMHAQERSRSTDQQRVLL